MYFESLVFKELFTVISKKFLKKDLYMDIDKHFLRIINFVYLPIYTGA